jgi:hypothetical protein
MSKWLARFFGLRTVAIECTECDWETEDTECEECHGTGLIIFDTYCVHQLDEHCLIAWVK